MTTAVADYETLRDACAADPLTFPRIAWGRKYWSRQADVYRACKTRPRVASKGGHSTGKTFAVADFICEHVAMNPGAKCVVLGPKFDQVKVNMWAAVRKAFVTSRIPLGGTMGADTWNIGPDWWARCAGADKPESLHLGHGEAMLVVIDEAVGVEPWAWEPINSMLASDGSRLIALFNPTQAESKTREIAQDPAFALVTLSCEDHPNVVSGENVYPGAVTREWVDAFKARVARGLASRDEYRSRVQGEFPLGGDDQLLNESDLEAVADGVDATDERRIGLDVARFGSDRNVLVVVDEHRRVAAVEAWVGADLMETTGRLLDAIKRHNVKPEFASVDVCGMGAGVVDRAREQGCYVAACDFGVQPVGDWSGLLGADASFVNRRSELHMLGRVLVRSRGVSIPREYRALWADLCAPRFKFTSAAKLGVESKDEMRKRIGRSPDYSDAFLIAFHVASAESWVDL